MSPSNAGTVHYSRWTTAKLLYRKAREHRYGRVRSLWIAARKARPVNVVGKPSR